MNPIPPVPKPSLSSPIGNTSTPVVPTPSCSTSTFARSNTHQLRQQLERQLAEHEKQLQESNSGIGKNVLARQISQLKDRLRELDQQQSAAQRDNRQYHPLLRRQQQVAGSSAIDDLPPATLEKLRNLERDLNNYRSPRIPRSTGLEPFPSPSTSLGHQSASSSLLPLPPPPAGSTPTKRRSKVPNADRRNNDIEFATEIGQGLLLEVRKMQALLQEKEEHLSQLEIQKADLERAAETMAKQLRQREENEERLKEDTWNLELAKQELTISVTELQQNLNKANTEQHRLTKQLNELRAEIERLRDREEKLNVSLEDMKARHEQEMSAIRRHAAGLQRTKLDQTKQIEALTSELAILKAQTRIGKRSTSDNRPVGGHLETIDSASTADESGTEKQKQGVNPSPPGSPKQTPSRNQALEVETLKTSLAHAHRMVSNLRSTLHKEKTEKFELKKLLAESQETIEQLQNDPRMWEDARASAAGQPRGRARKANKRKAAAARKSRGLGSRAPKGDEDEEQLVSETESWMEEEAVDEEGEGTGSAAGSSADESDRPIRVRHRRPAKRRPSTRYFKGGFASLSAELSQSERKRGSKSDVEQQAQTQTLADQLAIASPAPTHIIKGTDVVDRPPMITMDAGTQTDSPYGQIVEDTKALQTDIGAPADLQQDEAKSVQVDAGTQTELSYEQLNAVNEAIWADADTQTDLPEEQQMVNAKAVQIDVDTQTDLAQEPLVKDAEAVHMDAGTQTDLLQEQPMVENKVNVDTQADLLQERLSEVAQAVHMDVDIQTDLPPEQPTVESKIDVDTQTDLPHEQSIVESKAIQTDADTRIPSGFQIAEIPSMSASPVKQEQDQLMLRGHLPLVDAGIQYETPAIKVSPPVSLETVKLEGTFAAPIHGRDAPTSSPSETRPLGTLSEHKNVAVESRAPLLHQSAAVEDITKDEVERGTSDIVAGALVREGSPKPASTTEMDDNDPNVKVFSRAEADVMIASAVEEAIAKYKAYLQSANLTEPYVPPRPTSPPPSTLLSKATSQSARRSRCLSVSSTSSRNKPLPELAPEEELDVNESTVTNNTRPESYGVAYVNTQTVTYPRHRLERRTSSSLSSVSTSNTLDRRPSFSSSQMDAATRTAAAAAGGNSGTVDANVIALITQTMIGDWMYKYTRKAVGNGLSERRHRRFFWIHPYTRTLYWSPHAPGVDGRESKAKSALIENVSSVPDHTQGPVGLPNVSLLIQTSGRQIKITAPNINRHEVWFESLSYLLARAGIETSSITKSVDRRDELVASGSLLRKPSYQRLQAVTSYSASSLSSGAANLPYDDDEDDEEDEALEDVRMCCNGKHHVSRLEKDHHRKHRDPVAS